MTDLVSIATVIIKVKSFTKFIETGKLSDAIFGDIALSSAKASLSNAYMSHRPENLKSHVWNAISQLELGLTAHMNVVSSYDKKISQGFGFTHSYAAFSESIASAGKVYYISCIMAICYAYLKESALRDKYLSMARRIINRELPRSNVLDRTLEIGRAITILFPEILLSPLKDDPFQWFWWRKWHYDDKEITRKEIAELESYLLQQD